LEDLLDYLKKHTSHPWVDIESDPEEAEDIEEKVVVEDGVTVITTKNYKRLVYENSQDVLLEFYAPWCGHW
jgi:thioredoxin-like negative regulator of GroEL